MAFGQYCFNKLPLGITSALELFQNHIKEILKVKVTLFTKWHNFRLLKVLKRLKDKNIMLAKWREI